MRQPKCLARAKSTGKPCQARSVYLDGRGGGRCRFQGGLSTGPKTAEGLERLSAAVRQRWARYREAKALGIWTGKRMGPRPTAKCP
jgi:hypothetical protein